MKDCLDSGCKGKLSGADFVLSSSILHLKGWKRLAVLRKCLPYPAAQRCLPIAVAVAGSEVFGAAAPELSGVKLTASRSSGSRCLMAAC